VANTTVHVFMYYFYACQAVGIDVWWKRYLTSLQIAQFVADETGNVAWAYYRAYVGRPCSGSWFGFWFGMGIIASFLVLFIQFYERSYARKPAANPATTTTADADKRD
jgi:fatty acid elongase 3